MKNKLLFSALGALMFGTGVFTTVNLTQKQQLSDLTLANIEAMTMNGFDSENPCNNGNGYRDIYEGDAKVYDCCYQVNTGKGRKDCKRW